MVVTNAPPDAAIWTKPEVIWTKPEAADFLRIKSRTLDSWMRRGLLPFSRLPTGAVRFRRSQLVDFVAKYEQSK